MSETSRALPWAVLAIGVSGCFPYVLPPAQLSFAGGPARRDSTPGDEGTLDGAAWTVRGSVHPQQPFASQRARVVDVGLGYQYEQTQRLAPRVWTHGPYLEVNGYVVPAKAESASTRVGVRGTGELLFADVEGHRMRGVATSLAGTLEYAGYAQSDPYDNNLQVMAGEAAIGAFAGVGRRSLDDDGYWLALVGLTARIPFVLGIAMAGSSSSSSENEPSTEPSNPAKHDEGWQLQRPDGDGQDEPPPPSNPMPTRPLP